MALAGAVDAISPVQAGVQPLRRIGRGHLPRQHVAQFVAERLGVFLRVEIAALPAPIGPGPGEPVEHLPRADLAGRALVLRQVGERLRIGDGAPQEGGDRFSSDALQLRGHAGLAEIFLRQHVGGDLAPTRGNLDIIEREHHGPVGIADEHT